jgi:hypothetical protein
MIEFFLPGLLPSKWLSPNRGEQKAGRVPIAISDAKREMRGDVAIGALAALGRKTQTVDPAHIFLTLYWYKRVRDGRYRPEDAGNAIYSLKAAIDGLIDANLILDDGYRNVPLLTGSVQRCDSSEQEGLYIRISPIYIEDHEMHVP